MSSSDEASNLKDSIAKLNSMMETVAQSTTAILKSTTATQDLAVKQTELLTTLVDSQRTVADNVDKLSAVLAGLTGTMANLSDRGTATQSKSQPMTELKTEKAKESNRPLKPTKRMKDEDVQTRADVSKALTAILKQVEQHDGKERKHRQWCDNLLIALLATEVGIEMFTMNDEEWATFTSQFPNVASLQQRVGTQTLNSTVREGTPHAKLKAAQKKNFANVRAHWEAVRDAFQLYSVEATREQVTDKLDGLTWDPSKDLDTFVLTFEGWLDELAILIDAEGNNLAKTNAEKAHMFLKYFKTCPNYSEDKRESLAREFTAELRRIDNDGHKLTLHHMVEFVRPTVERDKVKLNKGLCQQQHAQVKVKNRKSRPKCASCQSDDHYGANCPEEGGRICDFFSKYGSCKFGDKCAFKHEQSDKGEEKNGKKGGKKETEQGERSLKQIMSVLNYAVKHGYGKSKSHRGISGSQRLYSVEDIENGKHLGESDSDSNSDDESDDKPPWYDEFEY